MWMLHHPPGPVARSLWLTTWLLVSLAPWAQASVEALLPAGERVDDLRPGRFYHGETRVRLPRLGVSFKVPAHWRVRLPAGSQVLHMDSVTTPGIGIVLVLESMTRERLEARLAEPMAFEEAYVLDPTGPVEGEGSRLSARYRHGNQVGRAIAIMGPSDQALLYLLAGPDEHAQRYEQVLAELADSTRFVGADVAAQLKQWYDRVSGKGLHTPVTAATLARKEWHFCSDGRFLYRFSPSSNAKDGRGPEGFEEFGRWRIEVLDGQPFLIVEAEHALPRQHVLRSEDEAIYLDDTRFGVSVSNRCF